jgi:hypothetical protein
MDKLAKEELDAQVIGQFFEASKFYSTFCYRSRLILKILQVPFFVIFEL